MSEILPEFSERRAKPGCEENSRVKFRESAGERKITENRRGPTIPAANHKKAGPKGRRSS